MSGGKKKRRDIQTGLRQSEQFTQQGAAALQPYAQAGIAPTNQLSSLLGLGTPQAQAQARQQFEASPFYTAGENAFGIEKDAVDSGLSSQGLLYSQSRQNAVADARQRNYANAFQSYLNTTSGLAGMGLQGAAGQAGLYGQQGQNALTAGQAMANTRQGFLGTLGQLSQIGSNFGSAYTGFSDRRLKSEIEEIGKEGPLTKYRWKWNDEARKLGLEGPSSGYMADEVEAVMPDAVSVKYGFKVIDYGMVEERLKA